MSASNCAKAWLIIRERGLPKREVILSSDRQWTIGRQLDCSILLKDIYVLRLHAVISCRRNNRIKRRWHEHGR